MRRNKVLASGLLAAVLSGAVWADGFHYTITVDSQLQEDADGKLTGLRMQWLYDPTVSQMLLEGEDVSANQRAATLHSVATAIVGDLQAYAYFTRLTLAGQALPLGKVTDYQLELRADQRLQLGFTLPLAAAQPLAGKRLELALADPAGTGALKHPDASHVKLGEKMAAVCQLSLQDRPQYAHGEAAQAVTMECR